LTREKKKDFIIMLHTFVYNSRTDIFLDYLINITKPFIDDEQDVECRNNDKELILENS